MKKTLVVCLVVVGLFALANGAAAVTCTSDQRPAATLLIPYFQATFTTAETDGTNTIVGTGPTALDTLVTIGNASSALMIAHVNVFNDRSELVLDFNVALTGFDIQSWSMASILFGNLPVTPVNKSHVAASTEVCQRGGAVPIYPAAGGYIRTDASVAQANPADNLLATTLYAPGPFSASFKKAVLDSLDGTTDTRTCGPVDGTITNPIHGYVTIDHANYCNLSNPSDSTYYTADAIGMENNLWGDYIFTNGAGLGTMGFPAVAIEADQTFQGGAVSSLSDGAVPPSATSRRTFYRRYVTAPDGGACVNPFPVTDTWNCGAGDQREPLGLKYAARWFNSAPNVTSFFNVWRASSGNRTDLLDGGSCDVSEPVVTLTFYDEDENTVTGGGCPSPCSSPTQNFPLETQRTGIGGFSTPAGAVAGWVNMIFFASGNQNGGHLDQAYVTYDFQGATAFLSAGAVASQLDPSACQPLGDINVPVLGQPLPVIPPIVGTGS